MCRRATKCHVDISLVTRETCDQTLRVKPTRGLSKKSKLTLITVTVITPVKSSYSRKTPMPTLWDESISMDMYMCVYIHT